MKTTEMPALRGGVLALLAAALFGISTPLVQRAGAGLGAFTTAALLYFGAALIGALQREPVEREAAVRRGDLPRLAWMALFGAAIGPVALAWGLQHTSGASGSLMLALEALFTVVLARMLYREVMDARVWTAMLLLLAGGVVLVVDRGMSGGAQLLGLLAVLAATAAWGLDNTLSRALAERDPGQVVLCKSLLGAATTAALAVAAHESWPGVGAALALLAIVLGDRSASWGMAAGGTLMLAGVALHLAESHGHEHEHEAGEHEHAHHHDDGHHGHMHEPMPEGAHSHRHGHEPVRHAHAHVPDAHHAHRH